MKKFIKISCITAAAMLVVGFIMTTITIALGAPAQLVALAKEGAFTIGNINLVGEDFDYDFYDSFNSDYETYHGSIEQKEIVKDSEITKLDISIACGKLTIVPSSNAYIGLKSTNADDFQYYYENGTFYLNGFKNIVTSFTNEIILYLPEDIAFEDISISLGGGAVSIDSLKSSSITIDIGAGDFKCKNINADTLSVDLGAGDCELSNITVKDADFSISMGDTNFDGIITGNLKAECAMGELSMNLKDTYADHNYDLECSMGSLHIGNHVYDNLIDNTHIENGSDSNFDIECSMGDVTLNFAN